MLLSARKSYLESILAMHLANVNPCESMRRSANICLLALAYKQVNNVAVKLSWQNVRTRLHVDSLRLKNTSKPYRIVSLGTWTRDHLPKTIKGFSNTRQLNINKLKSFLWMNPTFLRLCSLFRMVVSTTSRGYPTSVVTKKGLKSLYLVVQLGARTDLGASIDQSSDQPRFCFVH